MPVFRYKARGANGKIQFGVELASSREEALKMLKEKGLLIIELSEQKEHPMASVISWANEAFNIFRPKANHYAIFFRSLSTALSAGMTSYEALDMLSTSAPHRSLKKVAMEGKQIAVRGISLSDLFRRYRHIFPQFVLSLTEAGEESGRLDHVFALLADYYEREHEHSLELKRETFYPKLLFVFLLLYVCGVPLLISWLTGKVSTGEFVWKFIKGISRYALIIALCYFAIRGLISLPQVRLLAEAVFSFSPLVGNIRRRIVEARFLRALSLLQSAGIDAGRSLELAGKASGSRLLEASCMHASKLAREGKRMSEALMVSLKGSVAIQPTTMQMLSTAETTGRLDELLQNLANRYEQEAFVGLRQCAIAIGVLMLLVAAVIIGAIVISFYTGYYKGLGLQ
ncbi:MAG: hypothetical protein RUDDFDWM_000281 [Candidatus Fervidibacterota bacterium]